MSAWQRPIVMVIAAAAVVAGVSAGARQDPTPLPDQDAFLTETLARLKSNDRAQERYTYKVRETKRERDSSGRITKTTVRLIEVYPSPEPRLSYQRVVEENGRAPRNLADKDREFRQEARRWIASQQRKGVSPADAVREKREIERRKERAIIDELPQIYDFRLLDRDIIDGRPAIVMAIDPKPRSSPRTREADVMKHFAGKAWVDEQDYELVRAHMTSLSTVTYGWGIVARLGKGAVGHVERRKIGEGVWLPTFSHFRATGRVMLLKKVQMDQDVEYFDHQKADEESITTFPLESPPR